MLRLDEIPKINTQSTSLLETDEAGTMSMTFFIQPLANVCAGLSESLSGMVSPRRIAPTARGDPHPISPRSLPSCMRTMCSNGQVTIAVQTEGPYWRFTVFNPTAKNHRTTHHPLKYDGYSTWRGQEPDNSSCSSKANSRQFQPPTCCSTLWNLDPTLETK